MRTKLKSVRVACALAAVVALGALVAAPGASAHKGEYAEFNNCPSTNPAVEQCLYSVTTGGEVVLGSKKVPIVNPVVLQGGLTSPDESFFSSFVGATNGVTLSKAAQPVPGGLTGLVNCKEINNILFRIACEAVFENGLTGVNSTLELARPASEIRVSQGHLLFGDAPGLKLPVKVHLENPLFGSNCYIGSSASPLTWNLTSGTTAPPAGTKPITGSSGTIEVKGEDEGILRLNGAKFVDNTWSAPAATGCGGPGFELVLDPILDASVGVPAAAGKNTASLINVADSAPAEIVNKH